MDCQLKQGKHFKKANESLFFIWWKYVYSGMCLLNFYCILLPVFDTSPKHREVEYGLKVPVQYRFQWCKTTLGWLQRATWQKRYKDQSKVLHSLKIAKWNQKNIVVLKCKKMFLCKKIDKNVQLNSLFLWNF